MIALDVRPPGPLAAATARFRAVAGRLPTGVTVVAVRAGDTTHAMTVNSFTTVSLEPPLVLFCVRRSSRTAALLPAAGAFAVTVLPAGAGAVSARFADSARPPGLGDAAWTPGPGTGSPVLDCGLAYFDCTLETVHEAGDHDVCVGRVAAFGAMGTGAPLVFVGGGYLSISPPCGSSYR
ncbi:flavin reductase family protein [Dactylosporangium aurantiacum]|uniref:Flavin reductase family protein n=1 Tax=Dactylosporangium aurantiacum TaxID=35754 RepID=A0A9Q9IJ98_9ACTN|nr:flavin reductase family protein [Dactylosporangium aurantiacum]MDG6105516.1 flavin reductase family protein [Dactylosporangium aurantiacum]UWZ57137.1 flavin reductase family protein [Dactylosporangium aurantiacum]